MNKTKVIGEILVSIGGSFILIMVFLNLTSAFATGTSEKMLIARSNWIMNLIIVALAIVGGILKKRAGGLITIISCLIVPIAFMVVFGWMTYETTTSYSLIVHFFNLMGFSITWNFFYHY